MGEPPGKNKKINMAGEKAIMAFPEKGDRGAFQTGKTGPVSVGAVFPGLVV
jgi:hypothetical protein